MICLRCHNEMKKQNAHGVLVDRCPSCKGIWLDKGELDRIVRQEGDPNDEIVRQARKEKRAEKDILMFVGSCPKCYVPGMKKYKRFGITIDVCGGCGGTFFDKGELDKAVAAKKQESKVVSFLHRLF